MTTDRRPDERALEAILREIEVGHVEVYRNVIGQPHVVCLHPEFPTMDLYLFDRDFRGWISNFIWDQAGDLLREREIDRIVEFLAGKSMWRPIQTVADPALLQMIETESVIATVLEFMHTRERHESTMESLWKQLKKFAKERQLLVLGRSRFPGGPNVLSRKLRQFQTAIQQIGIEVEIKRSNGCKVTLIRRSDGEQYESSTEPLRLNIPPDKDLGQTDERASRLQALRQRRNRGLSPESKELNENENDA